MAVYARMSGPRKVLVGFFASGSLESEAVAMFTELGGDDVGDFLGVKPKSYLNKSSSCIIVDVSAVITLDDYRKFLQTSPGRLYPTVAALLRDHKALNRSEVWEKYRSWP